VAISQMRLAATAVAMRLVALGWILLGVLTPFYHPYVRLWVPLQAFGWLVLGGALSRIRSQAEVAGRGVTSKPKIEIVGRGIAAELRFVEPYDRLPWVATFVVLLAVGQVLVHDLVPSTWLSKPGFPSPLESSDY